MLAPVDLVLVEGFKRDPSCQNRSVPRRERQAAALPARSACPCPGERRHAAHPSTACVARRRLRDRGTRSHPCGARRDPARQAGAPLNRRESDLSLIMMVDNGARCAVAGRLCVSLAHIGALLRRAVVPRALIMVDLRPGVDPYHFVGRAAVPGFRLGAELPGAGRSGGSLGGSLWLLPREDPTGLGRARARAQGASWRPAKAASCSAQGTAARSRRRSFRPPPPASTGPRRRP